MGNFPNIKMTFPGQQVGPPPHLSLADVEMIGTGIEVPTAQTTARLTALVAFMIKNDGVLIMDDAAGTPTCLCCGAKNVFPSQITHDNSCVYRPFERLAVPASKNGPPTGRHTP